MGLRCFGEGTEDDPGLGELLLERGGNRDAVKHGIDGYAREPGPLVQGDPQLLVGLEQLRVYLVEALRCIGVDLRRRVVGDGPIVDGGMVNVRPARLGHGEPMAIGLQAPVQQELGLALLARDEADHVLVQARRDGVRFDVGVEARLVVLVDEALQIGVSACHEVVLVSSDCRSWMTGRAATGSPGGCLPVSRVRPA